MLGRTRSRGRCWAAIWLSHHPEPSGGGVHGEVDRLDIGGNMVDGFVLLRRTAEEAMPHLYKQERKLPTPVRRRLSRTQALLGRAIPGGQVPMSRMKVRGLAVLSNHSAFHRWSAQSAALLLLLYCHTLMCFQTSNAFLVWNLSSWETYLSWLISRSSLLLNLISWSFDGSRPDIIEIE